MPAVQGTVRSFAATTRSGTVLLDDGSELSFDRSAFERSGLRLLRLGQRVRLTVSGLAPDLRIDALTLATFEQPD